MDAHLLVLGGKVVEVPLLNARVAKELAALRIRDPEGGPEVPEVFEGVLLPDPLDLVLAPLVEAVEDADEEVGEDLEDLVVVLLNGKLEV